MGNIQLTRQILNIEIVVVDHNVIEKNHNFLSNLTDKINKATSILKYLLIMIITAESHLLHSQ